MSTEKIVGDLKRLSHDAEDLLQATANNVSDKAKEARNRLKAALESAKESCERLQQKAIAGARATDRTIRERPYQSIGVALGVGLLIGVLAARRNQN